MYSIENISKKERSIFIRDQWIDLDRDFKSTITDPEIAYLLAHNRDYKIDGPVIPFNKETWTPKYKKIIWDSLSVAQANGYGSVSEQVVLTLNNLGIDMHLPSSIIDPDDAMDKNIHALSKKNIHPDALTICYSLPDAYPYVMAEKKMGYTMFENTVLPEGWAEECNKMTAMIVPSKSQKVIFKDNGVKVPIIVFPHGVNQDVFHYVERPKRDVYRFIMFAAPISTRKGAELLYKAFSAAFPYENDVELYIKTTEPIWLWGGLDDPRIIFNKSPIPSQDMLELLYKADCMVFPTHGEGFGLPPLQAMATGLPTIVTGWSGCEEYAKKEYSYPIDYDIVDSPHWNTGGQWAEPNFEHLVELMRYCYNNREKAAEKGKKAAEWVKNEWSWEKQCRNFIKNIDKII